MLCGKRFQEYSVGIGARGPCVLEFSRLQREGLLFRLVPTNGRESLHVETRLLHAGSSFGYRGSFPFLDGQGRVC